MNDQESLKHLQHAYDKLQRSLIELCDRSDSGKAVFVKDFRSLVDDVASSDPVEPVEGWEARALAAERREEALQARIDAVLLLRHETQGVPSAIPWMRVLGALKKIKQEG